MAESEQRYSGKAITILLLGILSILIQEWLGLIIGIAGIVLYVQARNDLAQQQMTGRGIATAGFILSIVGTLMQLIDVIG